MNIVRSTAAVALALAATVSVPADAQASESSDVLSVDSVREVELAPGESTVFQKGNIAKIELITEGISEARWSRAADSTTAPNCIVAKSEKGFIQVYNNCGGTEPQRIKVTLAFAPDTTCTSIEPGTRANVGPALGGITGVYLC